ncbi:hypothetical protein T8T21_03825 [Limimaricola variabilis]|uniref:helix-turn-helix transcriptional regulator n=1 Tax=Limimaricola variabilis TaxID=1492771 RepID=UPI002AC9E1F8|nr:hypothetical protein [Limimaricola variabilis]WPY95264.1 hypothetical protein T8T21_03825 [Limimaricola variabilis]
MQHENQPLYIDTQTAANLLGISRSSLEKYRHFRDSKGPPFVVFGRGAIRYHVPSLLEWAKTRTVSHGAA